MIEILDPGLRMPCQIAYRVLNFPLRLSGLAVHYFSSDYGLTGNTYRFPPIGVAVAAPVPPTGAAPLWVAVLARHRSSTAAEFVGRVLSPFPEPLGADT